MDFLETLPPGVAILDFTVGIDGHVRDPGVRVEVSSDPKVSLAARVIERLFQIHWRPASLDRMPVEARVALGVRAGRIIVGSASPWSTGEVHKIRAAAEQGDPNAGYVLGMMLLLDSKIMPEVKGRDFLLAAAQQGHPKAAYEVARRFQWLAFCQKDDRRLPWLHYAAAAGEPIAQLALAQEALLAPGSMNQQQVVEFLQHAVDSDDFYVKKHAVALLATSPFEPIRKPPAALAGAQALLDAPIQSDPQMFEAVAAAYAANGDFTNARLQEDLALKKAGKLGWNTTLMEGRLAVYQNGKPWYGDLFALPTK